jgi:hypothetical protein
VGLSELPHPITAVALASVQIIKQYLLLTEPICPEWTTALLEVSMAKQWQLVPASVAQSPDGPQGALESLRDLTADFV